ncbi:MAG: hypothetical protein CL912_29110 [Deltaproteobacteria bacterium]|nr:hypothetical protein [Deltaproteobacteria bacterium]
MPALNLDKAHTNIHSYAIPSLNLVNNCPIFFNYATSTSGCSYGIDGAGTTIHEFTHTPAVYSPGTQDYAYGYAASTRLTSAQSLANADNFALYAKGKPIRSPVPKEIAD